MNTLASIPTLKILQPANGPCSCLFGHRAVPQSHKVIQRNPPPEREHDYLHRSLEVNARYVANDARNQGRTI